MMKHFYKKNSTSFLFPANKCAGKKLMLSISFLLLLSLGLSAQNNVSYNLNSGPVTGTYNSAFGWQALNLNTSGSQNTTFGYEGLFSNTTGYNNASNGNYSLYSNTGGFHNAAHGFNALYTNTTGSNNTGLGYFADVSTGNLSNAMALGANAKVTASNTIQLGDSNVDKVFAGVGNAATLIAGGLQITGGTLGAGKVLTSDAAGLAAWQTPASPDLSGYELLANKSTGASLGSSDILYPSQNAVKTYVDNQAALKTNLSGGNTFSGNQIINNDLKVLGRTAFGSTSTLDNRRFFDFSDKITDFPANVENYGLSSSFELDPAVSFGNGSGSFISHLLSSETKSTNNKDFDLGNFSNFESAFAHNGSGDITNVISVFGQAYNNGAGDVTFEQVGGYFISYNTGSGNISGTQPKAGNFAVGAGTGNFGTGSIARDYVYYAEKPYFFGTGTIGKHWGLYFEDQEFGGESWAMQTHGGKIEFGAPAGKQSSLLLSGDDIIHPMTSISSANNYGLLKPVDPLTGGLKITGTTASEGLPLLLEGYTGNTSVTAGPLIKMTVGKSDGGAGVTAVGPGVKALSMSNDSTEIMSVLADGSINAAKFIREGGTSSQFLKADGSVDTTSYAIGGNYWSLTGNAGTVDSVDFIGTTDNVPFNIRVNNQKAGRIEADPIKANTFYGYQSGNANTTGYDNTATGYQALYSNTTGYDNTANGAYALHFNTEGVNNMANGYAALYRNTTGTNNMASGNRALYNNTTGSANIANGNSTLFSNTTGYNNTAIGFNALYANTTGNTNTAIGISSLQANTTGYNNMANGYAALLSNIGGYNNTANGNAALQGNTTGYANTANGYAALAFNTTGNNNTALGYGADVGSGNLSNATAIGANATVNASNSVVIGNSSVSQIGGFANWSNLSDSRFKKNIKQNVPGREFINTIKTYTYTIDMPALNRHLGVKGEQAGLKEKETIIYSGFLAQEVEEAAKKINYSFSGVIQPAKNNEKDHYRMSYADFVVPLVKTAQEQDQLITGQQKQIDELQQRIDKLEKLLTALSTSETAKTASAKTGAESNSLVSGDIKVYPNPSKGVINISTINTRNLDDAVAQFTNSSGKIVFQTPLKSNTTEQQVDLSAYPSGVYLVTISSKGKILTTQKLIIE